MMSNRGDAESTMQKWIKCTKDSMPDGTLLPHPLRPTSSQGESQRLVATTLCAETVLNREAKRLSVPLVDALQYVTCSQGRKEGDLPTTTSTSPQTDPRAAQTHIFKC
eukprot:2048366-Amphidinium_carterae.1